MVHFEFVVDRDCNSTAICCPDLDFEVEFGIGCTLEVVYCHIQFVEYYNLVADCHKVVALVLHLDNLVVEAKAGTIRMH